jgi:hypothetical protein
MTTPARICLIGNSHLACLKLAWDQCRDRFPGYDVSFFGARGHRMIHMEREGDHLVSRRPAVRESLVVTGGAESIDTTQFDGFGLCGLSLLFPQLDRRLSSAVRGAVLRQMFEQSIAAHILGLLRQVTDRPVLVTGVPLTSAENPDLGDDETLADYGDMIGDIEALVAAAGGRFLPQPAVTREGRFGTRPLYSKGSVRMDLGAGLEEHPDTDHKHMNAAFGELVLAEMLPHFALAEPA